MQQQFQAVVNEKITIPLASEQAVPVLKKDTSIQYTDQYKQVQAKILQEDFSAKTYRIKIHASIYEVRLMNELDMLIDEMGLTKKTETSQSDLIAPMPGLIISVMVEEGQTVHAGDGLLILEAMKMENKLTARRDGVIKKIYVQTSETVDKGKLLIEFEKSTGNE